VTAASPRLRTTLVVAAVAAVAAALAALALAELASRGRVYRAAEVRSAADASPAGAADRAARRLGALAPRGILVTVDTYGGRLRVWQGERLLREAICSAGSGAALRDPRDGRVWIFETPIGERRVESKRTDPVWSKPDWAFVEEGLVPPPTGHADRYDRVTLGDYALYLGSGYLIHGTLFQTTLGRRVTHGCIRLGDEDLEWVYRHVPVGARVWLY